jgi:hypothetical protein
MDPSKQDGPNFPVSGGFVALAIAIIFYLTIETPFQAARPQNPSLGIDRTHSTEDVQARLWEDPFAAVTRHIEEESVSVDEDESSSNHYLEDFATDLKVRIVPDLQGTDVVVMPVMVFGGPYPEDQEERIRTRHAVLSALGRLKYAPRDEDHIGYLKPCDAPAAIRLPQFIPYEWFIRADSEDERPAILVLWLDNDQFQERPWEKLDFITNKIKENLWHKDVRFIVQGPSGSTVLREMAKRAEEIIEANPKSDRTKLKGIEEIEIYSPKATVAADYLDVDKPFDKINELLKDENGRGGFYRTIGTDTELARTLINEIQRRTPPGKRANCPPHIALISEWDTFYGRTFPEAFKQVLSKEYGACCPEREIDDRLHRVIYLRGIDGQGAASAAKEKSQAGEPQRSNRRRQNSIERPVGPGQFDYLRRLAESLERKNKELAQDSGTMRNKQIQAIGVVGSDVYDKLLILQALHDRFPNAIFFTTDLDANLTHPQELEWTRNLVVASHFGLELHPHWQESIHPFRGSYQTAHFFATKFALKRILDPQNYRISETQEHINELLGEPRIFEIGRRGAFDLSVHGEPYRRAEKCSTNDRQACDLLPCKVGHYARAGFRAAANESASSSQSVHPERTDLARTGAAALCNHLDIRGSCELFLVNSVEAVVRALPAFVVAVYKALTGDFGALKGFWFPTLILLVLTFVLLYHRISSRSSIDHLVDAVFLILGVLSAGALYVVIVAQGETGEPFAWFEGISIWPTQYLRLFAALLALYFLVRAWRGVGENVNSLDEIYFQPRQYSADISKNTSDMPHKGIHVSDGGALRYWQSYRSGQAGILASLRARINSMHIWRQSLRHVSVGPALRGGVARLWHRARHIQALLSNLLGWVFWSHPKCHYRPLSPKGTRNLEEKQLVKLWTDYHEQNRLWRRFLRVLLLTTLFILVARATFVTFGPGNTPARGELSFHTNRFIITWLAAPLLVFLIFWVVDATKRAVWLVKELSNCDTHWPEATRDHFAKRLNIDKEYLNPWIDIQFIGEHTAAIHRLVYLPVVVLIVLLLSRATYFDNWNFPVPLIIVLALLFAYSIYNAGILRNAAEHARLAAIKRLHENIIAETGKTGEREQRRAKQLRFLLQEVQNIREGAFLPLLQQPWLRAILLLLGGGGGLAYLEYFVWSR